MVTAPDIMPTDAVIGVPVSQWIPKVTAAPTATTNNASILRGSPPDLKLEKKPGPTCKPMEYTNRMRPNSFMKCSRLGFIVRPK